MFIPPYQTHVCKHYNEAKLIQAVRRVRIQHPLLDMVTPRGIRVKGAGIVVSSPGHEDIPAFTQPLDIGEKGERFWVVDARMMTRPEESDASYRQKPTGYRVTSERDFYFQVIRVALMNLDWESQGGVMATRLGTLPAKTFIRWIVGTLSGRLNLPMDVQLRLSVIVGFYYYLRFDGDAPLDRLAQYVSAATGVPHAAVTELSRELVAKDVPLTITDLVTAIAKFGGSVRLESLKYADVYALLMNSWSGVMARENVGVALESMPTFLAMCFTAGTDRSYRKSAIARVFEGAGRTTELKAFTDRIQFMIASELVEE
jgi:hypothetical protein